jgi:hypothetical protein
VQYSYTKAPELDPPFVARFFTYKRAIRPENPGRSRTFVPVYAGDGIKKLLKRGSISPIR